MLGRLKFLHGRMGIEYLIMDGQDSRMSHNATTANVTVVRDW